MSVTVTNNESASRYEVFDGGRFAGFAAYRLEDGVVVLHETVVRPEFGGRGLARALIARALADARAAGARVRPVCPFVRATIARDPEQYLDLVAPEDRAQFELPEGAG